MIIDFHVHCFPDELASRAVASLAAMAGETAYTDGTVDGLKRSMDQAGVDLSVLQPVATRPGQVESINRWLEGVVDERVAAFGALHPDMGSDACREALARIEGAGLHGVKLHPDYQHFFVDEERLFPVYEDIFGRGLYILFHAGLDIGLKPPWHCTPDRLAVLLDRFPEARIIAAHMGGFAYWDTVDYMLAGRDILFDTSYSLPLLGAARMADLIGKHGAERILFASDSPWGDQATEVDALQHLGLDESRLEMICSHNALRILEGH